MRNLINSAAATVMCAMIAASVAPTQAAAGVVGMGDQAKIVAASPVQPIYYRHYYRHYYHHPRYVHHYYYRHYYGYYPFITILSGGGRNGGGCGDLPVLGIGISLLVTSDDGRLASTARRAKARASPCKMTHANCPRAFAVPQVSKPLEQALKKVERLFR